METSPLKIGATPTVETSCWPADCRKQVRLAVTP